MSKGSGILHLMKMRIAKLDARIAKLQRRRDRQIAAYANARAEMLNPQHRPQIAAEGDSGE